MKTLIGLFSVGFLILLSPHVHAESTTPAKQIETFVSLSGVQPRISSGHDFFTTKHGRDWSCSSCHTTDPTALGKHIKTGKAIQPMAPAANPERFTDAAKTEKWFRRNCNDVVGRECTPEEKSDVLSWLLSLRK
jgi:Domain of unknown function (DUF1924)